MRFGGHKDEYLTYTTTITVTPNNSGYEVRLVNDKNGHYFRGQLSVDDAWRLVELIHDVESVRGAQDHPRFKVEVPDAGT